MEKQHLPYEDFYEQLWGNISARIVTEDYISQNKDFIDTITFDAYRLYEMDDNLSMSTIKRMIESFFFSLFRFQPNVNV